jgi:hypothetical protein
MGCASLRRSVKERLTNSENACEPTMIPAILIT